MKKLTPKQESFAQLAVKYSDMSKAYRESYDCSNTTDKSVNELASRLGADVKIISRMEELKIEDSEAHGIDRAFIINGLLEIISDVDYTFKLGKDNKLSKEDGKAFYRIMQQTKNTDKLRALEMLSKMLGLNSPEEVNHTHVIKPHTTSWGI